MKTPTYPQLLSRGSTGEKRSSVFGRWTSSRAPSRRAGSRAWCFQFVAALAFTLTLSLSPARAQDPFYIDVLPVPATLQTGLDRLTQPWQHQKGCNPRSVACVPTSASMILKDRGQVINPEMAAGKYAPPVSGGTNLRSAARDLLFNGNIPSNLYVKGDIQANPYILRQIAQNGQSAIVGYRPAGSPNGHAMIVDGVARIGNVDYYIMRDPWPEAPHGGQFLKPQSTLEPHVVQVLEPLTQGARPDPRLDPQRPATGGPFKGMGPEPASSGATPSGEAVPPGQKPGKCAAALNWMKGTAEAWEKMLQAKFGINSDLTNLNPTRRQFNEAARKLGPAVDKVFIGLTIAHSGYSLENYFFHMAAATDLAVSDAEAQKHFAQAQTLAEGMLDTGTWGVAWALLAKASPTTAAIVGSGTLGYYGGRWVLENTKTGNAIEAGSRGFFDWMFGNKDDRGGPLTEQNARQLLESYERALDAGHIKFRQGASLVDLAKAVKSGNMFLIHNAIIEEARPGSGAGCPEDADAGGSFSLVFDSVELDKAWEGWTVAPGLVTQKSPHGWHSEHTWDEPPLVIDQNGFAMSLNIQSTSIKNNRLYAGTGVSGDFDVDVEGAEKAVEPVSSGGGREKVNTAFANSEDGNAASTSLTVRVKPRFRPSPGSKVDLKVGAAWGPGVTYHYKLKTEEAGN